MLLCLPFFPLWLPRNVFAFLCSAATFLGRLFSIVQKQVFLCVDCWCVFVSAHPWWLPQVLATWSPVLVHDSAYSVPKPRTLVEVSCCVCGKWLKGRAALTPHLKMAHGLYPYLTHFLPDSTCPVCRKLFISRAQTLQHVYHSSCGAVLGEGSFPLVDLDIFESLNRQDR